MNFTHMVPPTLRHEVDVSVFLIYGTDDAPLRSLQADVVNCTRRTQRRHSRSWDARKPQTGRPLQLVTDPTEPVVTQDQGLAEPP